MARKSIQIERVGHLMPRERMWAAMLQLGRFQAAQIEQAAHPAKHTTLQTYIQCLAKGGFIRTEGEAERFSCATWVVVKRPTKAPMLDRNGEAIKPSLGTLAMWRAMKVRKVFDADEIAADATQGGMTCSRATVRTYLQALLRSGYLRVEKAGGPRKLARLRLVNDTGPLPPAITRAKVVFDRNTGKLALAETAQEVGDGLDA
ncbi:hypothetical protein [Roseateles chitinivorans]|uniref:hypothetical protein n=1 Tax=Roseateles chitinivorans TaxID=2917965 RepID=UPI003D667B34